MKQTIEKIKISEINEVIKQMGVNQNTIINLTIETVEIDNNSPDKLFRQLRGKIQYFEDLTTPTTEEWGEI